MIRMRDKNQNYIQFTQQVENFLKKKLLLPRLLRTAVSTSSTLKLDNYNIVYPRSYKDLRNLIVVNYYNPENLRWRIFLDLNEKSFSNLNNKQRIEISLLLHSKEKCFKYLYLTERYSSHEIFGNILETGCKVLGNLQIRKESTKLVVPEFRRGYRDKGSLRPKERWLPDSDYSLTEMHMNKEKKTDLRNKTIIRLLLTIEDSYNF